MTFVSQSETGMRIWWPGFDRLTTLRGWTTDAERARQLNISHATLTNLRAGKVLAGPKVINAALRTFGSVFFELLFDESSDGDQTEAA